MDPAGGGEITVESLKARIDVAKRKLLDEEG